MELTPLNNNAIFQDHSDTESTALTCNGGHGTTEGSHIDQALGGSMGGSSVAGPDDLQEVQSAHGERWQRLSATSNKTEASTASLAGDVFEESEDSSSVTRRSSAATAKCKLLSPKLFPLCLPLTLGYCLSCTDKF